MNKYIKVLYNAIESRHFIKALLVAIVLTFSAQWYFTYKQPATEKNISANESVELDTFIPKNHTLLPIKLKNHASIISVLGKYGIVDLYKTNRNQKIKIAENIRIARAPKNPNKLFILVPTQIAKKFIEYADISFAVIKSKSESSPKYNHRPRIKRTISIGVEK